MTHIIPPVVIVIISMVAGALLMARLFQRNSIGSVLLGVSIGALAGGVGSLLFSAPVEYCAFEAERSSASHIIGAILVVFGVVLGVYVAWRLSKRFISGESFLQEDTQQGAFRVSWIVPVLLLLPSFLIITVFIYYPVLETFRLSTLLARLGAPRTRFICLDNFTRLLESGDYINTVVISFVITIAIVVIGLSLSLLIATMAYQPIRGARIYRIFLVWPYALSPVIAGIIFQLLFNPIAGVLNHILELIFGNGAGVEWLLDPTIAPLTVILASVWNIMGYNILFYIAGLQNVPGDLVESAAIDGANVIQRFFRITFPLLSPITFFLIVTNTTYSFFQTFGLIDFLTGGGPSNATTTMMYDVYELGIVNRDLGKAAAQSLVLFLIVIGVTLIQFRASRDTVTYGA